MADEIKFPAIPTVTPRTGRPPREILGEQSMPPELEGLYLQGAGPEAPEPPGPPGAVPEPIKELYPDTNPTPEIQELYRPEAGFAQFKADQKAAGLSDTEIAELWHNLRYVPNTTVDILPGARQQPQAPPGATIPGRAPSGATYPEKSALDRAIGTVGRGVYEYTKGLTGPVWESAKFLAHDEPDWWLHLAQSKLNPDVPSPGPGPLSRAVPALWETLKTNPTDLLGRTARGIREEGWSYPVQSPGNVGTAVGDTLMNLMLIGPLTQAAKLGRAALPVKAQGAIDRAIGTVVPKYNFTDAALAEEAAREGRYLAGSAKTQELTQDALKLMKEEPGAAPLLQPKIAAGKLETKRFQKEYEAHQQLGPAGGWVPFDYKSRKLELSVDDQGRISYLRAPEFNALTPGQQARIGEIRNTIETNSQALNAVGIVADAKQLPGYLATKYSAFEQPKLWNKQLKTSAGGMTVAAAKDYISRKTGIVNDAILNETIKEILSPQFKEVWQTQNFKSKNFGRWSDYAQNLAKRKNLPPELEALLGPMERAEAMPYRVGYTLDAQLKMLTNHQTLTNLGGMLGNDGKPLMYTGPLKPPGYVTIPKDEIFGQWGGSHMHRDIADILPTLQGNTTNRFLAQYMTAWKASKTTWSPSTHLNNVMGDVLFAHLAGVNPLNPLNTRYYLQSANELTEYLKNPARIPSANVREALESGGIRPGFAGSELQMLTNRLRGLRPEQTVAEGALGVLTDNKVAQKLRDIYDAEDQVFRYAGYLKNRAHGMTPMEASAEVNKYFPSYATSSPVGRFLRGQSHPAGVFVGGPFSSFPLEATRIYATAAREKPWRLSAVGALPLTLTALNTGNAGISMEEWHRTVDRLPSRGKTLIPMVGPDGQLEVADWSNIIPLGSWSQLGGSLPESGPARDVFANGPLWNAAKLAFNHDFATGQKLIDPAKGESYPDMITEIGKQMLPAPTWLLNALPPKSRINKALEEVPPRQFAPEPETVGQSAWRTLFPNLDAKSIDELERQGLVTKRGAVGEARRGKRSIQRNPSIVPQEKERRVPNVLEELYNRKSK